MKKFETFKKQQKVSIIIPAHNEEKRIGKTLKEYISYFKNLKKQKILDFELIVVLNACSDNTSKVVEKYSCKELKVLEFKQGGKGFAITEGFKEAIKNKNIDFIGFVDADLATPPKAFYDLIKTLQKNKKIDGTIASRWLKNSVIKTPQTLLRKITSRGFNFLVRGILFLPYKDTQCGAKLFKRKAIEEIITELTITMWAFDIDLLYRIKKNKNVIAEIPTVWEDKRDSKLNLIKVPFKMFSSIIRLRLIHSKFNFVVKAYDKLPERIKIHNI